MSCLKAEPYEHHDNGARESVCEEDGDDDQQGHRKPYILAYDDTRRMKWRDHEQKQNKEDRQHGE